MRRVLLPLFGIAISSASACGAASISDVGTPIGGEPTAGRPSPAADAGTYEHLLGPLYQAGSVAYAFREPGRFNFNLPDAWLVRMIEYRPTGARTADYTVTLYVDDTGTSGKHLGQVLCTITGSLVVADVAGHDPLVRIKTTDTIATNACTGKTGVTDERILEVRERDADGRATLIASWALLDIAEDAPFPGWLWAKGKALAYRPCAPSDRAPGRDYCAPGCDWSYVSDPVGTRCVK